MNTPVVGITRKSTLKRKLRAHLRRLGFTKRDDGTLALPGDSKDIIRRLHHQQRTHRLLKNKAFILESWPRLSHHFADGIDLDLHRIRLRLQKISAGSWESDLFRLAGLTWSIPVSGGFGRRLRYLVWDEANGRLAGLIALGDPVFNLSVRDNLIGWSSEDRTKRLVNVLDAYALGSVPPYSFLLGGKAIACMIRSKNVFDDFTTEYHNNRGVISAKRKKPYLLAVTTSSSLGRSSIYNLLKLQNTSYFQSLGFTEGWGHFHIPDDLFLEFREYLRSIDHHYPDQNRFGQGPNWRLRTIRATLSELDFNEAILRHGVKREVFFCSMASNALDILRTGKGKPNLSSLLDISAISELALERWIRPRAQRRSEYLAWRREGIAHMLLIDNLSPNDQMEFRFAGAD